MADFDFNNYLTRRNSKLAGTDKLSALAQASQDKVQALAQYRNEVEQRQTANVDSWVSKLGLNPVSAGGSAVNLAASLYSGASRFTGQLAGLRANFEAITDESHLTEPDYAAYNRQVQGQATPEDQALLAQPRTNTGRTALELFERAAKSRQRGQEVADFFDNTQAVQQDNRQAFAKDLGDTFDAEWGQTKQGWNALKDGNVVEGTTDLVAGLGKLVFNAGDAVGNNPMAALEYIVENAPQVLVGGVAGAAGKGILAASNIGYATDHYQKGIEAYQAKNNGAFPSAEQRQEMAMYAASMALAEQVGEVGQLRSIGKALGKTKPAVDAVEDVARTGFKQSLLNIGKATAQGTSTEALTEGYQTFAEGEVLGEPASAKDIYTGAVIGGVAGGGLTGGVTALAEAAKGSAKAAQKAEERIAEREQIKAAGEANDPTPFLDSASPSYDPVKAIQVLHGAAAKADATSETKQANLEQAAGIVTGLQNERSTLVESLASLTPEGVQQKLAKLEELQAALDPVADATKVEQFGKMHEILSGQLESLVENPIPQEELAAEQAKLTQLDARITQAQTLLDDMATEFTPKPDDIDVEAEVAAADSADTAVAHPAAQRIINLSMAAPEKVSVAVAERLAANTANGLTDAQRAYLRKFSQAQVEANKLKTQKGVAQDIYFGSKDGKMVGISQYRKRLGDALNLNNEAMAAKQLAGIKTFARDHEAKAKTARAAMAAHGLNGQIVKAGSQWQVTTGIEEGPLRDNGGLTMKSPRLVEGIEQEALALTTAAAELQAMYDLKFTTATPSSAAVNTQSTQATPVAVKTEATTVEGQNQSKVDSSKPTVESSTTTVEPVAAKPAVASSTKTREASAAPVQKDVDIQSASDVQSAIPPVNDISVKSAEGQARLEEDKSSSQTSPPEAQAGSNEDVAATSPSALATATPSGAAAPVAGAEAGGLSIFSQRIKDLAGKLGDTFRQINPLAQFLTQAKTSERYKTNRPLVARKDFFSAWRQSEAFPEDFLEEDTDLTEEQRNALNNLFATLGPWIQTFNTNLKQYTGNPDFKWQDMMQFLIEESPDGALSIEENVRTAMGYAMYRWILDKANAPALLTREQINTMHGRDKDGDISPAGVDALQGMTNFEDLAINELGSTAAQALGLKLRDDAPQDLLPKLKTALGVHILALLEAEGYVERQSLKSKDVNAYFPDNAQGDTIEVNDFQTHSYVRLKREAKHALPEQTRRIKESNYGSQAVVDRLFGIEDEPRIAETKPRPFTQEFAQTTDREITDAQRKVIDATMQTPHTVIPEMFHVFDALGKDAILRIAGAMDLEGGKLHITNRKSAEAQNLNLENQYDLAMEMLGTHGIETEYFVGQSVWRNFRAGFTNQSLNQQTSKIHRVLFARPNWQATIRFDNEAMVNEFLISAAMNLGMVKTDQQRNEQSLEMFKKKLAGSKMLEAIEALRSRIDSADPAPFSGGETALIRDAAAGAEGMMSLQAMVAYAKYLNAQERGDKDFTVTMLVGADGKTNGPILTHLALGAAASVDGLYVLMNRGGMYSTDEGQPEHFSEYFEGDTAQDLYEDLAAKVIANAKGQLGALPERIALHKQGKHREAFAVTTAEELAALEVITKPLLDVNNKVVSAGRNLVKTPLTSFAFGSALKGSVKSMENAFIASIYSTFEDLASGKRKDVTREQVLQALNVLISKGDHKAAGLNPQLDVVQLLEMELRPEQETALRQAFQNMMGKPVEDAMKAYFATFIQRRNALNKTIQASFAAFDVAYTEARAKEMERLMDAGEIAFRVGNDGVRSPLHDMTAKQEAALRKQFKDLLPVMHTAYSLKEKNLGAGLYMAKSQLSRSQEVLYFSKVAMQRKIRNSNGDMKQHLTSAAMVRGEVDPGVAGTPYAMHSSDSANMHGALLQVPEAQALNVHDEISTGVPYIAAAARAINAETVETFLHYSPAREALVMLERLLVNMAAKLQKGEIDPTTVQALFNRWAEVYNRGVWQDDQIDAMEAVSSLVQQAVDNAYHADKLRLGMLAKLKTVDQYTWEGGQFEVPQATRDEAAKQLKKLGDTPKTSVRLQEAVAYLNGLYDANGAASQPHSEEAADPSPHMESATALGVAGVRAPVAVAAMAAQMPEVAAAVAQGQPVVEAVNALAFDERTSAIQAIAEAGARMPDNAVTPWGILGTPTIQSDPELVALFEQRGEIPAEQLLRVLKTKLERTGPANLREFNRWVLMALAQTVNKNLVVRYVTPTTPAESVLERGAERSRGWYVNNGTKEEIYVLSPDFTHSGLTPEVLLHELIHASVAASIETATGDAKALVQDLETLRTKAREYVNGLSSEAQSQYAPALSSVQEIVAWGMSNLDFQKNVLSKITMQSRTRKNGLVTAMKEFIDTLVGLIFRTSDKSRQAIAVNGMTVLINNVAGLFEQTARNKPQASVNLSQQAPDPIAAVQALTTTQLFDALDTQAVEPAFAERLRGLLTGIVTKLHGPYGSFKALVEANVGLSPLDLFQRAKDTGVAPFASKVMASHFPMNDQVAFVLEQVEATVRAALADNEGQTSVAYRELSRLYMEAHRTLKAEQFHDGDWATATPTEQANAQALYDFVFDIQKDNGDKSDYLARFAALGLAHPQVNKLLQVHSAQRTKRIADGKTIAEKLEILFENLLTFLNGKLTKTYDGQRADQKLETLVEQLVGIEAKKRRKLAANQASKLYAAEESVRKFAEKARSKVGDIASADFLRNNRFALVRGTSGVVSVVAKDQVERVITVLTDIRNKQVEGKNGFIAGMVTELKGLPAQFQQLLRWAKNNERQRKFIITEVGKTVLGSFVNNGKELSPQAKAAISAVFLRTDLSVLLDQHGVEGLQKLLDNRTALHNAIRIVENELVQFKAHHQHFYLKAAKDLAHYKATGAVKGEHVLMNAHNIARLAGTQFMDRVKEADAVRAEALIDKLVSLRALQGTGQKHKAEASKVLAAEMARADKGNGIEMVLRLHRDLQQQSKERLFKDAGALVMKGYVPEIFNPNTKITVADETDGADLIDLGYVRGAPVGLDPADPNTSPKHFYVLKDGGLNRHITGTFSLTGQNHAKGSRTQDANTVTLPDGVTRAMIEARKQAAIRRMFDPDPNYDPDKVQGAFMAPVINAAGTVADYRYMMLEATKDSVLERTNDFDALLGTLAGSIFDKETSKEQNRAAVKALREQYQAEYKLKPEAFVEVGPTSTDPELREIYRMLPQHTKEAVRSIWGREGMKVRVDLLNINFGYRKFSAADSFDKVAFGEEDWEGKGVRGRWEDAYVRLVEKMLETYAVGVNMKRRRDGETEYDPKKYAKRAGIVVRRAEKAWQEVVHEIKDIIVTKTGTVLLGNVLSNLSLLAMNGVGLSEGVRSLRVAIKGTRAYQKDHAKLLQLRTQLDSGYLPATSAAAVQREINQLEDWLARNPVKTLIDAGLMPTIVEDVAAENERYSYKSAFVRKMDKYTNKLHPGVVKAGRAVYMAHDTKLYQGLAHWTQLSDFAARYALYQHLTQRKVDPMESNKAIQEASDAFVNYDIPMPKGMQYLDDMGITMFTKYFIRIQRVLMKLLREHPTRVIGMALMNNYLDLMPMVTDSSMMARLGNNPLNIGALQFPATLDELATVNVGLSLFK